MNKHWVEHLVKSGGQCLNNGNIIFQPPTQASRLYPLCDFSVISITGDEAEQFLQGQLTCNVKNISHTQASLAALCNAKGRVISTLIICKTGENYLLILPSSMEDSVLARLKMYVLRAKVSIQSSSNDLCLCGLQLPVDNMPPQPLPHDAFASSKIEQAHIIKLPGGEANRYLAIVENAAAPQQWQYFIDNFQMQPANSAAWTFLELSSGLPWLSETHSEEYIPQMLNIDKLGGISFDKGCYTGQEIIARTHYLGKAKREMHLASCPPAAEITDSTSIVNSNTNQSVGKILSFAKNEGKCHLLFVLSDENSKNQPLVLTNDSQDTIEIIPFQ